MEERKEESDEEREEREEEREEREVKREGELDCTVSFSDFVLHFTFQNYTMLKIQI